MLQASALKQAEAQEQIYSCSSQMYSEAAKLYQRGKDPLFWNFVFLEFLVLEKFLFLEKFPDSEIVAAEGNDGRHSGMDEVQECAQDRIGSLC